MKKFLVVLLSTLLMAQNSFAAWPSDSTRTKNWGSEVLTDADLEAQFDLLHTYINDMMDETSGHKHDGTANEGPQIQLNGGTIGVTGELQETDGGTGMSSYTQGDIIYASAADTLSVLAKNTTATRYLSNTGTSNNPAWAQVNIINGLTIASQAQGDLIYADSATTFARLGAGTSGQYLKTQGAAANPIWASIPKNTDYTFSASPDSEDGYGSGTNVIQFETEDFDTGSNFASSTFTAPVTGKYLINVMLYVKGSGAGSSANKYEIFKNGSLFASLGGQSMSTNGEGATGGSVVMSLTANDTVDVRATRTGSNSQFIATGSKFSGCYLP